MFFKNKILPVLMLFISPLYIYIYNIIYNINNQYIIRGEKSGENLAKTWRKLGENYPFIAKTPKRAK